MLEHWVRDKLQALGDHLSLSTTALKRQGHWVKSLTFFNAIAWSGKARPRVATRANEMESLLAAVETEPLDLATEEYIRGSPRVALEIPNRFSHYVFIERDPIRAVELQQQRVDYPDCRFDVRQASAHVELDTLLTGELG